MQRFAIYRFQRVPYLHMKPPRDCAPLQPGAFTHCPQWSLAAAIDKTQADRESNWTTLDEAVFDELKSCSWPRRTRLRLGTTRQATRHVSVTVRGPSIRATANGAVCEAIVPSPVMTVGRFGVYAFGTRFGVTRVAFRNGQRRDPFVPYCRRWQFWQRRCLTCANPARVARRR